MKSNTKNNLSHSFISIVVPVFDESENINSFYKEISKYLKKSTLINTYEIIFIDDGSLDDTSLKIKKIIKLNKKVKLISFTKNQGVNTTFAAGVEFAKGNCMIFIDVDGQYPMSVLDEFTKKWIMEW